MNMKIFATDYDGTLRMVDGISEDNIKAIEKFRSQGNLFGVVTGRDYTNGYKIFKKSNDFRGKPLLFDIFYLHLPLILHLFYFYRR